MNKRIKFSKYIFKNKTSFIDFKIKFYFNLGYNHHVSSSEIKNIKKYEYTFEEKTTNQKQEIKLNNFLIKLLNCFKIDLIKESLKIDVDLMNEKFLKYNENENTLERIGNKYYYFPVPLKKISKKNCNSNENKFSIKILNTDYGSIRIGITNSNFNFKINNFLGNDSNYWLFYCCNGAKFFNGKLEYILNKFNGKKGDVIGFKFNSIKGEIELFINNESKGIIFKNLNINENYRFVILMWSKGDKVQIIQ